MGELADACKMSTLVNKTFERGTNARDGESTTSAFNTLSVTSLLFFEIPNLTPALSQLSEY